MSKRVVYLTDEQWKKIEPLIPKPPPRPRGGRPRADDQLVFEGILWVLKTGGVGKIFLIGIRTPQRTGVG